MKQTLKWALTLSWLLGSGFILLSSGCKPKQSVYLPPVPTPTPVIAPGSIVFTQQGHLVRLDLDTNQTTPLTGGKSTEWFPSCSPKGDEVAYWSNGDGEVYNLWKINLDGSNRTQLTFEETSALKTMEQNLLINDSPSWSNDGKKILYSFNGDIWMMDSDGFNPETLLLGHSALCPTFSPDQKSVAFITNQDDTVYNIWIYSLIEKSLKKATNYTDWNVGSLSYSADGKKFLYNLYRANVSQVYTLDTSSTIDTPSTPINITNNNRSLSPRFAQMDRKLIYCSYGTGNDIELNVYLANSNGTEVKALTTLGGASPSWAPARIIIPSSVSTAVALPTPIGK